jgi:GNAT superfamily N-acetyltransferase
MEEEKFVSRPFDPQDCERMPTLLKKVWKFESNADYWRWRYIEPPFETDAVVIENENNEIIGFNGYWIRPVQYNNEILYPRLIVDTMVAPEYQGTEASKLILNDFLKLAKDVSLFGFTNAISNNFYKKYIAHIVITDTTSPGYQAIINIGTVLNAPKPIRPILNGISRGLHKAKFALQNSPGIEVVKDENIDEEFNVLWKEASSEFLWIQVRDMDYLRWRYQQAPGSQFHIWKARENGKLVGYMVSNTTVTPASKRAIIVDWLASLHRPEIFRALLSAACRWNLGQGVDIMEAWLLQYPPVWEKILRSHLLLFKRSPRTFLSTGYPKADSAIDLYETLKPEDIVLSLGDSDYLGWASIIDFHNKDRKR